MKLERVNMTTVGVTRGLFPLEQPPSALLLSDRCPLSVAADQAADAVAFHTERATACRNSLDTFQMYRLSAAFNESKPCSTEIMQH